MRNKYVFNISFNYELSTPYGRVINKFKTLLDLLVYLKKEYQTQEVHFIQDMQVEVLTNIKDDMYDLHPLL